MRRTRILASKLRLTALGVDYPLMRPGFPLSACRGVTGVSYKRPLVSHYLIAYFRETVHQASSFELTSKFTISWLWSAPPPTDTTKLSNTAVIMPDAMHPQVT